MRGVVVDRLRDVGEEDRLEIERAPHLVESGHAACDPSADADPICAASRAAAATRQNMPASPAIASRRDMLCRHRASTLPTDGSIQRTIAAPAVEPAAGFVTGARRAVSATCDRASSGATCRTSPCSARARSAASRRRPARRRPRRPPGPTWPAVPTSTPRAPKASALRMSVPRRKLPSTSTGTLPPTASTIAGSARINGIRARSRQPPVVRHDDPVHAVLQRRFAASGVVMPLTITGTVRPRVSASTAAQSVFAAVAERRVPPAAGAASTVMQIALQPAFTASWICVRAAGSPGEHLIPERRSGLRRDVLQRDARMAADNRHRSGRRRPLTVARSPSA